MHVVTISASYGAGGGYVGPAVAERLGVAFLVRAIPVAVANDLGIPVHDAVSRRAVDSEGGVILGRGAAIVLADRSGAFHVRLDGDPERRVRQAMALRGISESAAREALLRNDKARHGYVRHFYGEDATRSEHYHLVLDSTQVPLETCVDVIVSAVRSCAKRPA